MINRISTYFPFAKATYKSDYFAYKSRFFLWSMANAVSFLAQLFLGKAVYANSAAEVINGYSLDEMVMYLGMAKMVECMSFASVESNVSEGIRDGRIVNNLIKPINYRTELLFRAIGQVMGSISLFLPVYMLIFGLFAYTNEIAVPCQTYGIVIGFVYLVLSFMMNYYISLIASCLVFRTVRSSGIYQLKKTLINFMSGSFLPIVFYPRFLQHAIKYLPFVYLRYYPSVVLQGKLSLKESLYKLCIGFLWMLILGAVSTNLWKRMTKKLVVFGG